MIFLIFFLVIIACFSFVLLFGAPYLPTHNKSAHIALDLLELKPGDNFFELGCGDGRVLILAAKRGYKCVGWELNPIIYLVAKVRTAKYKNVSVKFGSFWEQNLSKADGVYVFLLDKYMQKLDKKLTQEMMSGAKLASYAFKIKGKKINHQKHGVFLYKY